MTARQKALAAGEKRYHGRPCKNCGATEKWASTGSCIVCMGQRTLQRNRERYANDPEYRERMKARARKQKERYANDPEYRERYRERVNARDRERYANDPEYRERYLARRRTRKRERMANDPEYRERLNARRREWLANLSGFEHNRLLLYKRRWKALRRMEERNQSKGEDVGTLPT